MKTNAIELEKNPADTIAVLKAAFVGLLSFTFGGATIFSAISPFGIAFVACLPIKYAITASIGTLVSVFLFAPSGFTGFYMTAILMTLGIRISLSRLTKLKLKPAFLSIIAITSITLCTVFYNMIHSVSMVNLLLMIVQILLCGCFAYFFAISADALLRNRSNPVLSYVQITSISVTFICVICAFAGFSILNINIGVILGVLCVYILMCRYGIIGASMGSILVAIALNLYSIEMLEFSGLLIISSFLAGAFSPLGKFGQLSAFITVSTFCMILLGAPVLLSYRLIDVFIATAFFVIIPERLMMLIGSDKTIKNTSISSRVMQTGISSKLNYASDTILDLQQELETISSKFNDIDYNNILGVSDFVANSVCKGCTCALNCWDTNYNDTVDAFNPIIQKLKINNSIDLEHIPQYLADKCCKLEKLISATNLYYTSFLAKQHSKRQVCEARKMVFEQFHSIADMLCEMSEEISEINNYDEAITRNVISAFTKLESAPLQVSAAVDKYGRTTVEIYTDNMIKTSPSVLCVAMSNAATKLFDLPSITTINQKTKIAFFEKANYTIDFSVQQSCFAENQICGDSYEYFTDSRGYAYLLLSDGMGKGKRAAIDSVMTCSLMAKLIKAGFGIESAIKLINSSLLVKSTDESLSTIDMAKIDLYTGKVEFLKAGATTSFLDISGDIKKIESDSLPIGIIQDIKCDRKLITMKDSDILVLVSDGATATGEGYIVDEIKRSCHKSAKDISVKICHEAKQRMTDHQDDITVIVAKLQKGV